MQTRTNGRKTRKATRRALTPEINSIAMGLLSISEDVAAAQRHYDAMRSELEGQAVAISIRALTTPLFSGKSDEGLRPATNELERKLAIEMECHSDVLYIELRDRTEEAERNLRLAKDTQENLRLIAQLMIKR